MAQLDLYCIYWKINLMQRQFRFVKQINITLSLGKYDSSFNRVTPPSKSYFHVNGITVVARKIEYLM